MARRSDHTREELKQMSIVAGQKIFIEDGFSKFSARKVSRHIGYTVGTVYNVFGTHENIILNINAATLDDMHDYIKSRIDDSDDNIEAIRNLLDSYMNFAEENYNRWSALFEFNLPQEEDLPEWYGEKIKNILTMIEEQFMLLFSNDIKKAKRSAKVLWAGVHGICQLKIAGGLDTIGLIEDLSVLTDSLIDNYVKGLQS